MAYRAEQSAVTRTPAAPVKQLTAADIAYLRWLMQFDRVTRQIAGEQSRALPSPLLQRDQTRLRAILRSWEDSRREAAAFSTKASMATAYTLRLQQMQAQFQSQPAPTGCAGVAEGYRRFLAGLTNAMDFQARVYRQSAQLIENPRAATQLIPAELQDGGIAADRNLRSERESARESTNAELARLSREFPDQLPADIAGFHVEGL